MGLETTPASAPVVYCIVEIGVVSSLSCQVEDPDCLPLRPGCLVVNGLCHGDRPRPCPGHGEVPSSSRPLARWVVLPDHPIK